MSHQRCELDLSNNSSGYLAAHDGVMREKDVGAFDGTHWLVRSPRADGTVAERCDGNCDALKAFLDEVLK